MLDRLTDEKGFFDARLLFSGRAGGGRFWDPSVGVRLYYAAFALYSIAAGVTITTFVGSGFAWMDAVDDAMQVLALLLLFVKAAFFQRYTYKQLIVAVLAVAVFGVSAIVSKNFTALWFAVLVVSGQGVNIRAVACILGATSLFVLMLAVFGSSVGFLENVQIARGGSAIVRNSMGFTHPNGFGETVAKVCLALALLKWGRLTLVDAVFFAISAVAVVVVSDSRTFALAIAMMAVLSIATRSGLFAGREAVSYTHLTLPTTERV